MLVVFPDFKSMGSGLPSPLDDRRELLRTKVLSKLVEPIRYSPTLDSSLDELIRSVREQKFEGLIAKRRESVKGGVKVSRRGGAKGYHLNDEFGRSLEAS